MSVPFSCCLVLPDSYAASGPGIIESGEGGVYIVLPDVKMRIRSITSLFHAQRYIFTLGASEGLRVTDDDAVPYPPSSSGIEFHPVSVPTMVFLTDSGHSAIVEFWKKSDK